MPVPHYAKRRDKSEGPIVEGLRDVFGDRISIDDMDKFDLLIGYQGRTFVIEVKTGKAKLRDDQLRWHLHHCGENYAVNNLGDAITAVRDGWVQGYDDPLFNVDTVVLVTEENGWKRTVKARKFLLGKWYYLVDGDEILAEDELLSLME